VKVNGFVSVRWKLGHRQLERFMQRVRVDRRVEAGLDGREQAV